MSHKSGITFFNSKGEASRMFLHNVNEMDSSSAEYTQCQLTHIAEEGAVWIVYSEEHYGRSGAGVGSSFIVYPEKSGKINVGFTIKSAQAFNVTLPCIALFEHSKYRGYLSATDASLENITERFPTGVIPGASSAIALSGNWIIWSLIGFNGTKLQVVDAIDNKQEVSLFRDNDKGESLQLVRD